VGARGEVKHYSRGNGVKTPEGGGKECQGEPHVLATTDLLVRRKDENGGGGDLNLFSRGVKKPTIKTERKKEKTKGAKSVR